jgi:hypothetical protein
VTPHPKTAADIAISTNAFNQPSVAEAPVETAGGAAEPRPPTSAARGK